MKVENQGIKSFGRCKEFLLFTAAFVVGEQKNNLKVLDKAITFVYNNSREEEGYIA